MRIADISTITVNADMRNWVFVKVETDVPGLVGWGEATLEWKTRAVIGAIEDLKPLLIGTDPRDITQAVRIAYKRAFWPPGAIGKTAVSGVEQALWDILGKDLGVPVWRLLGGKVRDRVRLYTHLGFGDQDAVYRTLQPEPLRDRAVELVEAGFDAFKVVFVPFTHYTAPLPALRAVDGLMATLRDAVGPDVDLMVDFHGRCGSVNAALQYARVMEPYGPMFIEEPIQPGNIDGLRRLGAALTCPVATGERLCAPEEFADLFAAGAIDIAQPDLCHCGGISAVRDIAAAAATAQVGIAPHNSNGPIAGAAALHLAVATQNHVIQEVMERAVPWYDDVVSQSPLHRTGAHWAIPEAPGLGVDVDEVEAARHPYQQEPFPTLDATMPDGTVVDW